MTRKGASTKTNCAASSAGWPRHQRGFFGYTREAVATGQGDLVSLAVSDGRIVRGWGGNQHDAFNIGPDNTVRFVRRASPDETGAATDPPVELHHAMAGNVRLIEDGVVLAKGGIPITRRPRSGAPPTTTSSFLSPTAGNPDSARE